MNAPAEPVPTLELPPDRLMQWSQMALLLAGRLAERRERLDRLAWSDAAHAARAHDLVELRDRVEPAVRVMTTDEITQWPSGGDDATGTAAPVSAALAPINDRWALRATARGEDDTITQTWVSCRDEHTARDLAREILRAGQPEAVARLGSHVQRGERLATARAVERAGAPLVDRDAMATHLRDAWPPDAAAAVLGCRAWPTLAAKLATAEREGRDLTTLLGGITTSRIPTARKPAALAAWMLDQTTAGGVKDAGGSRAPERPSPAHPNPDDHDQGQDQEEILSWVQRLDPTSTIDRVGALSAVGYYGTGVDARLVSRYPDLLEEAAHRAGDEAAAEGLAGERERSAAAHQATVDDPATPQREDLAGQELAGRDLHEAAAARVIAAESHGAVDAAVARANVTLTAPNQVPTGQPAPHVTPAPHRPPRQPTRALRRGR